MKSKSQRLSDISTYNGIIATKPQEQANLYNIHFHSVFAKDSVSVPSILMHDIQNDQCASHHTDYVSCNTYEVQKILQTLDISKSAGVDKIPARLLKKNSSLKESTGRPD